MTNKKYNSDDLKKAFEELICEADQTKSLDCEFSGIAARDLIREFWNCTAILRSSLRGIVAEYARDILKRDTMAMRPTYAAAARVVKAVIEKEH